jgi:hypothetical protein
VQPPTNPAAAFPHAAKSGDRGTAPAVIVSYLTPWTSDLKMLGQRAGITFTTDPIARLGIN